MGRRQGNTGRRRRRAGRTATLAALMFVGLLAPAPARALDCLSADPPPVSTPANALRFGITPQAAGSAGPAQGEVAPEDQAKTVKALDRLEPNHRRLVLRLNRLFWSDGQAGIDRFAEKVDAYAAEGFQSEIQVRYHPPAGHEGDIAGWEEFVRAAVRQLAARPAVVAMSITNGATLPISPNTSDGAYAGVLDALVQGIIVARQETIALGRPDLPLGFTVMWRWDPNSDQRFWEELGARATPEFRSAL